MPRSERGGQAERLSAQQIVETALRMVEADGSAALSLRRLADRLHVTPMALYWHFSDKDALLDALAERLFAAVRYPDADPGTPWHERLDAVLQAFSVALRAYRSVAEIASARVLATDSGRRLAETVLELLAEAGFDSERAAALAGHLLCSLVSLTVDEPGALPHLPDAARQQQITNKRELLQSLDRERFPALIAAAPALADCPSRDEYFRLGITVLTRGVAAVAPVHE